MMRHTLGQKISVCLLTYNHAHLLESTLESIQRQTIDGYEIIISDDNSTDNTWDLLQRLKANDSRIRIIRTPNNLGMPGNANFAVAQTNRPYIALLHHDDLNRTDLLEKWVMVLERYPNTGFVFNSYGVDSSDLVYRGQLPGECIDGNWLLTNYLFSNWGCLIRGTAMIRRSAWRQVGGMRLQFGLLSDIDLWMRLAMQGPVGYIDEPIQIIRHDRPEQYPMEYKASEWSWLRQRYLYEIHAANRLTYYDLKTLRGRLAWWKFRLRLNLETTKWLTYAVVRRKHRMIAMCPDSVTTYDLWPLNLYRWILQKMF